jgi:exodeoxyribonuclease V
MISDHVKSAIQSIFKEETTPGQENLIHLLSHFVVSSGEDDIFLLKGYAGTGKTSILAAFAAALQSLRIRVVLLAPTGRAAKVLSSFTGKPAFTIHKKIYRQRSSKDGLGMFVLNANLSTDTFFIVDEASMIANQSAEQSIFGSGKLLDDLVEFVYSGRNCRLVLSGDTAQLPPVGLNISPALNSSELFGYGHKVTECILTDIVRQSEESGILHNATAVRKMIDNNRIDVPKFSVSSYKDIIRISGKDVTEAISECYDKYGIEETMVVCRSNKNANTYNAGIRNRILWRENEISSGDYLMVVKNNYFWMKDKENLDFIANGDIAQIVKIKKIEERYGFRFADSTLRFIDYDNMELDVKILINTLTTETASLNSEENKKLFYSILEDYGEIKSKKKQYEQVKEDPYFNALQVKFSYAVTCHKAQGGQWKAVFVEQGYFVDDMLSVDYLRWLYTALTRSTKKLYLVNFNDAFFHLKSLE